MATAEAQPFVITEMELRHIPGVLEIERRSFPTPWSERAFVSELTQNAYAHYIVALRGGRVVGYGGMWLILDEAHVTNIAVHPQERRQGLGRRLLQELERRAQAHGCQRMTLEVRPSNVVAQHLYRSMGFVVRGLRPGYYTDTHEDAIIMWKEIPRPEPGDATAG
jgi:ribosomal-protein-alanine N-acetyltransferase